MTSLFFGITLAILVVIFVYQVYSAQVVEGEIEQRRMNMVIVLIPANVIVLTIAGLAI